MELNLISRKVCFGFWLVLWECAAFAQSYTITTYAGPPLPPSAGPANAQSIGNPFGVAADGAGGVYFSSPAQHRVYHVGPDGNLDIIAGTGKPGFRGDGGPATAAELNEPSGIAADANGNILIADTVNNRIRKVTATGVISTIAGDGNFGDSGDGGRAIDARLALPSGVALDNRGDIFIADTGNVCIRKIAPDGTITRVAGDRTRGFSGDGGPALNAQLFPPTGIAVDVTGNLYIADANSAIRKVDTNGIITTIAGGNGRVASVTLFAPRGVAVDSAGTVFIADSGNHLIRKITAAGIVSDVAGNGTVGFGGDGRTAMSARLDWPVAVAIDPGGNLFIADTNNYRIRKLNSTGIITTVSGIGSANGFSGDGGPALSAQLDKPQGVAVDSIGNVFIADTNNHRIRMVDRNGVITTVVGTGSRGFSGDGGAAISAQLNEPSAVAVDAQGNLLIADAGNNRLRKVSTNGIISTIAGSFAGFLGDGGPAISARLYEPSSVAIDAAGNIFVADMLNNRVREITPDGIIHTVAGTGLCCFDGDGGPAIFASLTPYGVAVDSIGNLFITDGFNNRIRKVGKDGIITTVGGNGGESFSGDGGPAIAATFAFPTGIAVDASGNLFITSDWRVREILTNGIILTVAGTGLRGFSGEAGPAISAQLDSPAGIAVDAAGRLFIADAGNHRIRMMSPAVLPVDFSLTTRGSLSVRSMGLSSAATVGYASIQPDIGSSTASGLAIFTLRQNGVVVSEATVPASAQIRSGRIYSELTGSIRTGVAMANPNEIPAVISFSSAGPGGAFAQGETTIPGKGQIAAFLDEAPFRNPALNGAFTFHSTVPISVIALRGRINERGEFLMTTMPVHDLDALPTRNVVVLPHFADGGGWITEIVLVNTTDTTLIGSVEFRSRSGQHLQRDVSYSLSAGMSQKLQTPGSGISVETGYIQVIPAMNTAAPGSVAVFSFRNAGITVTEASVLPSPAANAVRMYAEWVGPTQTGIAVVNTSANATTVLAELISPAGSLMYAGQLPIPANGQTALFLDQIQWVFYNNQAPFQGILRLSSPEPISVIGLRGRYNERGEFLITTIPPANELAPPSQSPLFFPHFVDSGGYSTQFILFSSQAGQTSSGTLRFSSQFGTPLNLTVFQ